MANPPHERAHARTKAQSVFEVADARTKLVKQITDAEKAVLDARTAKLRALRLAKEAEDEARPVAPAAPSARRKARR